MDTLDEAIAAFDALDVLNEPEQQLVPQAMFDELREANLTKIIDPELKRVVTEIEHIAFANIADVFESEEVIEYIENQPRFTKRLSVRDITDLPRHISAAIQSVTVRDGEVQIKMYDKLAAQDKLMKHLGGYQKENEQKAEAHGKLLDALFKGAEAVGMPVPSSNDA